MAAARIIQKLKSLRLLVPITKIGCKLNIYLTYLFILSIIDDKSNEEKVLMLFVMHILNNKYHHRAKQLYSYSYKGITA